MTAISYTLSHQEHGIPIYSPSFEQFKDFSAFISSIEKDAAPFGICKIIPPFEWKNAMPIPTISSYKSQLSQFSISKSLYQIFDGSCGIYHLLNQEEEAFYTIRQYEKFIATSYPVPRKRAKDKESDEFKLLESTYWKILPCAGAHYAADLSGSLFPNKFTNWNLFILPSLLSKLDKVIPGVTSPYLYIGSWKSTFAWHVEVFGIPYY